MAQLYRKSALEKISNPEQLDKALTVTSSMSWLALGAITLILIVTIVWSIVGKLPSTVTAAGIVISADKSTNAIRMDKPGKITDIMVEAGDEISDETEIVTYELSSLDTETLKSPQIGRVTEIVVEKNKTYQKGDEVIMISPLAVSQHVVVCYVKASNRADIERCMNKKLDISITPEKSQNKGHMMGRIINIDDSPVTVFEKERVLGSNNSMDSNFESGSVIAVTLELLPNENTVSGYYWSNKKGAKETIAENDIVSVKFTVDEQPPITKLFSKLKDIWEGKA